MDSALSILKNMIATVARALGDKLLREVAFVGGCATGFLVTDTITQRSAPTEGGALGEWA